MDGMSALAALENSAPATFLRQSFYAYPLVNAAHILSIGAFLTAVLVLHARKAGIFARRLSASVFDAAFQRFGVVAFVFALATGMALFSINATEYAANPAFRIKLLLIGAGIINFGFYQAAKRTRHPMIFAIPSAIIWIGTLIAGRLIGFL